MSAPSLSQADVEARIVGLDEETQRKVVCSLVGHSRIQTTFWGYFYCARCQEQVGDNLAGAYAADTVVIVGHACDVCRKNAESFTWKDTFMAPDPFPAVESEAAS